MLKSVWLFVLSMVVVSALFGQTTALNGTVTDPTGAVIPDAAITIVNVENGIQRSTVSDSQGRYTMPQLPPGTYKLTAKSTGFTDVVINEVVLAVDQPA